MKRSRRSRIRDAVVWGVLLGASAGAVIAGTVGALVGAVLMTAAEVYGAATRRPGVERPLWQRTLGSAGVMALVGALLDLVGGPLFTGVVCGFILGVLGLRPLKLVIGLLCGIVAGKLLHDPPVVAAVTTVGYRFIAGLVYRKRPLVRIMAEEVPSEELRYVVPFEARSRYVGADYVEQLAALRGGTFRRNPPDVGILASLDALAGPTFDPARVDPLIREFYEHTSRFKLSIVPEWREWMKPAYGLFKRFVATPLGQAAIPSNLEEAQRGMVSTIDTIDLDGDEEIDVRGWIRTFADSGDPIYVGIYTSFRHEGRGYVSVGFPLPSANFTATLLPRNAGEHDLLLTSRADLPFPGHYLSAIADGKLSVIKLLYFQEQILVTVRDGVLAAEHSFALARQRFLTLHYTIERLPATSA